MQQVEFTMKMGISWNFTTQSGDLALKPLAFDHGKYMEKHDRNMLMFGKIPRGISPTVWGNHAIFDQQIWEDREGGDPDSLQGGAPQT